MEVEVSAEVHFAQKLAANEKKIRDRAIKRLSRYLSVRSRHGTGLSEADLLKIWKGLFYCMWMQDKPLVQEELSQRITKLIHCLPKTNDALRFVKVFLETLSREWNGIDRLRLDKFMMLERDMLHQVFVLLSSDSWPERECCTFSLAVGENIMCPHKAHLPDGPKLHLADIFVEELRKVPVEKLSTKTMIILMQPFLDFILCTNKIELARRVMSDVILKVLKANSKSRDKGKGGTDSSTDETEEMELEAEMDESGKQTAAEVEEEERLFHLDKVLLLRPMFEMARRKEVRTSNRSLIYGLVKGHSKIYDDIVNSAGSPEEMLNCNVGGDVKQIRKNVFCYLQFLRDDDGQAVDQKQLEPHKKKKRRKKGVPKEENITAGSAHESNVSLDAFDLGGGDKARQSQAKKQKAGSVNDENAASTQHKNNKLRRSCDEVKQSGSESSIRDIHTKHQLDGQATVLGNSADLGNKLNNKKLVLDMNNSAKCFDAAPRAMGKKRKHSPDDVCDSSSAKKIKIEEEPTSSLKLDPEKSPKKKKVQSKNEESDDGCDSVAAKKIKIDDQIICSLKLDPEKSPKKKKVQSKNKESGLDSAKEEPSDAAGASDQPTTDDTNFNARPKSGSKNLQRNIQLDSPVQLVKYSPKSPNYSILENHIATDPPVLAAAAPPTSPVKTFLSVLAPPETPSSPEKREEIESFQSNTQNRSPKPKLRDKNSAGAKVRSSSLSPGKQTPGKKKGSTILSGIVGDLYSALSVPYSAVSKAISNITPRSDGKSLAGNIEPTPPGMESSLKKKVIFDLRRNKANKFQDYLKSVARQPDSPYEPTKSPVFGILKSPAASPALSRSSLEQSSESQSSGTGAASRRARSAQGKKKNKRKKVNLNTRHNQVSSSRRK